MVIHISKRQLVLYLIFLLSGAIGWWCYIHDNSNKIVSESGTVVKTTLVADSVNSEMRHEIESQLILERVRNIFRLVKSDYMAFGGAAENELLDKSFCSKSWNKLLMAVRKKEMETSTMFFEVNYWTMTRNSGIINFDEFEVKSLELGPRMMAKVSYTVYETDSYNPAMIDLVYEDGQWKIDNFYHLKYMLNLRNCMWNYLANESVFI